MKYYRIELIEEFMKKNNMSFTAFCKYAMISPPVIKRIMDNKTNINLKFLYRVADALHVHILDFVIDINKKKSTS